MTNILIIGYFLPLSYNASYASSALSTSIASGDVSQFTNLKYSDVFKETASPFNSACGSDSPKCVISCSCNEANGWYSSTSKTGSSYNTLTTKRAYAANSKSTVTCYKKKISCPDGYFKDDWDTTHPYSSDPIYTVMKREEHSTIKGCFKPKCNYTNGAIEYTAGVKQLEKNGDISINSPTLSTWGGLTCALYNCNEGKRGTITNPDSNFFKVDELKDNEVVVCSKISCAHTGRAHTLCGDYKTAEGQKCYFNPTYNTAVINFFTQNVANSPGYLYAMGEVWVDGSTSNITQAQLFVNSWIVVAPTFKDSFAANGIPNENPFSSSRLKSIGNTASISTTKLVPTTALKELKIGIGGNSGTDINGTRYYMSISASNDKTPYFKGCYQYSGNNYAGRIYLEYKEHLTSTDMKQYVCRRNVVNNGRDYTNTCEKTYATTPYTTTSNVDAAAYPTRSIVLYKR